MTRLTVPLVLLTLLTTGCKKSDEQRAVGLLEEIRDLLKKDEDMQAYAKLCVFRMDVVRRADRVRLVMNPGFLPVQQVYRRDWRGACPLPLDARSVDYEQIYYVKKQDSRLILKGKLRDGGEAHAAFVEREGKLCLLAQFNSDDECVHGYYGATDFSSNAWP